jgi:DNA-binding NarL/FixJ family response regulator
MPPIRGVGAAARRQFHGGPIGARHTVHRGLIVEDQPATAAGLQQVLVSAFPGIDVCIAATLAQARALLREHAPELALVDLSLPDGSGAELIEHLAAVLPRCHRVVTTIFSDDVHLFPALRAGAHGYLLKDQPREQMAKALAGIVDGEPPLSPAIARRLLQVFQPAAVAHQTDRLTPRERETLALIAKGFKLPDVALQLGVTRNTAAGFIKAIYRKLNIGSRAEATLEAARRGLVRTEL